MIKIKFYLPSITDEKGAVIITSEEGYLETDSWCEARRVYAKYRKRVGSRGEGHVKWYRTVYGDYRLKIWFELKNIDLQ